MTPFHLAFPVDDIEAARGFYHGVLGCSVGRESARWIDFDFFGHQITAHLSEETTTVCANTVDGDAVPVRHFGAVLPMDAWEALEKRLRAAGIRFRIEPHVRFKGEVGEQATLFIDDPAGNALEFKAFANPARVFANS